MAYTPENNPYIPGDPYSYDLKWIVDKLKEAINLYQPLNEKFDNLYDYVHDYFDNLDLSSEVRAVIDDMTASGFFNDLVDEIVRESGTIQSATRAWLQENVTPVGGAVVVDASLTVSGAAADAKATGDRFKLAISNGTNFNNMGVSDLNDLPLNSIRRFNRGINPAPSNLPTDDIFPNWKDGANWIVLTLGEAANNFKQQLIMSLNPNKSIAQRSYYNNSWHDWNVWAVTPNRVTLMVTAGDSSDLIAKVGSAFSAGNTDVIIPSGVYDIPVGSYSNNGLPIGKGIKLVGQEGTILRCNNSGTNSTWSILNSALGGDFEIDNISFIASNIRYLIHDENASESSAQRHIIKNCSFYLDNRNNTGWTSTQCIGGGLGQKNKIHIENCTFESYGTSPDNIPTPLTYHNNSNINAKSDLWISNNYFINGTIRMGYLGSSTNMTHCYLSNNKLAGAPIVRAESSGASIINMDIIAWSNDIA